MKDKGFGRMAKSMGTKCKRRRTQQTTQKQGRADTMKDQRVKMKDTRRKQYCPNRETISGTVEGKEAKRCDRASE
jgi:hypothetical protein